MSIYYLEIEPAEKLVMVWDNISQAKNIHIYQSIQGEKIIYQHGLTYAGKYTMLVLFTNGDIDIYAVLSVIKHRVYSFHRTRREAEIEEASVIRKYKQLETSGWSIESFKAIW